MPEMRTLAPKTIVIETHADEKFGSLSLRAEVLPLGNWRRISLLSIRWLGREIIVPSEVYSDLRRPDVASFHCAVWLPAPDRPELEVSFNLSDPRYIHRVDKSARVHLIIVEGRVVRRAIQWFSTAGEEHFETKQYKP